MKLIRSLRGEDQRNNKTIKCKCLSENQNQNHTYEDFILLRVRSYTCISHYADRQSCSLNLLTNTNELKPQQSPDAKWAYPDLAV